MAILDDIHALLADSEEQLATLHSLHDEAIRDTRVHARLKTRVKSIVEHYRSVLDYLAVEITSRYGKTQGSGNIYYPFAQAPNDFGPTMERNMPGVAAAEPTIADAISRHQPYDSEALRNLSKLVREQKHNRLTEQIVQNIHQCEVVERSSGAVVAWKGIHFRAMETAVAIESDHGSVSWWGHLDRPSDAPPPFDFDGPTGVLVFGVPIDPATQQPFPDATLDVASGPIRRWCFTDPAGPLESVLRPIQAEVTGTFMAVAHAARL